MMETAELTPGERMLAKAGRRRPSLVTMPCPWCGVGLLVAFVDRGDLITGNCSARACARFTRLPADRVAFLPLTWSNPPEP